MSALDDAVAALTQAVSDATTRITDALAAATANDFTQNNVDAINAATAQVQGLGAATPTPAPSTAPPGALASNTGQ